MDTRMAKRQEVSLLDLPSDIHVHISKKFINMKDFIRFGAVCRSWYSIYKQYRRYLPRQYPLFMFAIDPSNGVCSFDESSGQRTHSLQFEPIPDNLLLRGSTEGWLVFLEDGGKSAVVLLNLFLSSDNKITFPPLNSEIDKILLSSNPVVNPNYVVAAVNSDPQLWAIYKPGNTDWVYLKFGNWTIENVYYYKNMFHVSFDSGMIVACDETYSNTGISQVAPCLDWIEGESLYSLYLVESAGDLLQVKRLWDAHVNEDGDEKYATYAFRVFRLDQVAHKWIELESLGGRTLFVGDHTSMSLLASDFPWCRPNCIYFTADSFANISMAGGPWDTGVYKLEDRNFEPHLIEYPAYPAPFWIEPTLP